ncbi:MAG TPA: PAS domain S-box protein [Polyangiaceae bacterium]|nr:PAS domain S-box protein [Polyangiaceae bacterium]
MSEGEPTRLSELLSESLVLDRLVDGIPAMLYVFDLKERRNVYANRSMTALLGLSLEEVKALGDRLLLTIVHPDDLPRTLSHHERIPTVSDGRFLEIEYRVRAADGTYRWLHSWETILTRDPEGRPLQLMGVAQDVTERATMEQELLESRRRLESSEQRWRSIAENPFDFVVVIDRDYKYTYVNWAAPGLKAEDLIGKATPFEFVDASHHAVMRAAFEQAFRDGRPASYDVYVPSLQKWYSSLVGPIREGDVVTHASVLTRDITREKESQAQARHADEQLRLMESKLAQSAKLEAVGQLAGGIAHDFNNLLTGIAGIADLLAMRLAPDPGSVSDIEDLRHAVERGAGLARQLLAFSRQQPIAPTVIDLRGLLAEMGRLLGRLIGEKIELVITETGAPVFVLCDRNQLEQVLLNLVVNARDAMPNGGRLVVELGVEEIGAPALHEHPDARPGTFARLSVADSGIGMDQATMARIFEPFFTTKPIGAGTGLGLSMVYGIVRQSGGFITVESELGRGTTFRVHLPTAEPEPRRPARPAVAVRGGPETVLLVEDNEIVQRFTRRILERLGYRVHVASRGDTALQMMEEGLAFDVLVTDVLLPGLNGNELHRRALELGLRLPVVFMSGYTDGVLADAELQGARAAFLQKPFTVDALAEKVRGVLEASR